MRRLAVLLALTAALAACNDDPQVPAGVAASQITMSVAPNPIATIQSNPTGPTFSVRFTTTLKESAGLGATVELVQARLFDDATGLLIAQTVFDDKDLVVFVGSKRVEGNGQLEVKQDVSYVATAQRPGYLTVTVRLKDDRGNAIEQALLIKVS